MDEGKGVGRGEGIKGGRGGEMGGREGGMGGVKKKEWAALDSQQSTSLCMYNNASIYNVPDHEARISCGQKGLLA